MPAPATHANDSVHPLTVHVDLGPRSYDVLVGDGLLQTLGARAKALMPQRNRAVIVTDSNVGPLYAATALASLREAGIAAEVVQVPAGEASKSMSVVQSVCSDMARHGLDRKSFVVALGGGVIGDLAGFCAAIYQRGIPYIQMPTTILSQVDSSVGGKTGVNLPEAKNMVGCFHQPALVLADTATLGTLHDRERNEGFAEIIKHAAIRDAAMYDAIFEVAAGSGNLAELIRRNIAIKAVIVQEDEFETIGTRALLNFGHTLGHAIEAAAGYGQLLHGEAISLGLRAAAALSCEISGLSADSADMINRALAAFHLPLTLPTGMSEADILGIAMRDKKFEQGRIRFVLLHSLGDAFVSTEVTHEQMRQALHKLTRPV